jgi:hypothetical protein
MTDHANKADTEIALFYKYLIYKGFMLVRWLAWAMQYSLQVFIHQAKELKND